MYSISPEIHGILVFFSGFLSLDFRCYYLFQGSISFREYNTPAAATYQPCPSRVQPWASDLGWNLGGPGNPVRNIPGNHKNKILQPLRIQLMWVAKMSCVPFFSRGLLLAYCWLSHMINGNFYEFLTWFCWEIPLHKPYIHRPFFVVGSWHGQAVQASYHPSTPGCASSCLTYFEQC